MHCPLTHFDHKLESQINQSGISTLAPSILAYRDHRLPLILHRSIQNPVQSYSKGSRGLSVLPQVYCIFTAISISLSLGWRQRGHRYAIRAGRNLPDKEFRSVILFSVSKKAGLYLNLLDSFVPLFFVFLQFQNQLNVVSTSS